MNDTSIDIIRKQFEIIYSKPLSEKILGLCEMTDLSRSIVTNSILRNNPDISETDLKIELFRCFYHNDFEPDEFELLISNLRNFWLHKQ